MATVRRKKPVMSTNRGVQVSGRVALGSRVLAQRNQPAVAVGAWVESGTELHLHPNAQASLTEQLQEERRRRSEQRLREFQETVRLRVVDHQRNRERLSQPRVKSAAAALYQWQQECPRTKGSPSGDRGDREDRVNRGDRTGPGDGGAHRLESAAGVRLHLACSQSRPTDSHAEHMYRHQDDPHRCALVQHKVRGQVLSQSDQSQPEEGVSRVLWPLDCTEELRRQKQAQILKQRRLFLTREREHVKENQEFKRHMQRTASLKSEKERARVEEERRLERASVLSQAQHTLEERERHVQERLRTEAEDRGEQRHTREYNKPNTLTRQMGVLRAQLRELSLGSRSELPPLCCCGSFWESHPDTCANNCVFHNNPKVYVQALQAAVRSWDLH